MVDPLLTSTPCVDQPPNPIEQEIPDLYPSCAVTRAMAKKAKQNNGMQDINLADTLIGQSFNDEISNSLSPSQADIQTDFDTSRSNLDLSPSISNDQLSRSQLCKEQHNDPEISSLFDRALDENEMSQVPVCYYVKNDNLMRKWRPPDVSADEEWTVNHQIVVPRAYRPEISEQSGYQLFAMCLRCYLFRALPGNWVALLRQASGTTSLRIMFTIM